MISEQIMPPSNLFVASFVTRLIPEHPRWSAIYVHAVNETEIPNPGTYTKAKKRGPSKTQIEQLG